eukprot:scaffold284655_cov27-Tisochrysis_lutea.AAC.1
MANIAILACALPDWHTGSPAHRLVCCQAQPLIKAYGGGKFESDSLMETEEALEELRSKYRDTRARMDAEVETLVTQVNALTRNIEAVQ